VAKHAMQGRIEFKPGIYVWGATAIATNVRFVGVSDGHVVGGLAVGADENDVLNHSRSDTCE